MEEEKSLQVQSSQDRLLHYWVYVCDHSVLLSMGGGLIVCFKNYPWTKIDTFLSENNALFTSSYNEVTNLVWVKVLDVDLTQATWG